jgi:tetratricopeptide (TPR) repeat protein
VHIEHHADGSVTAWLSEHEPMNRMKGMHGVCLHPGKAYLEVKARVYNRTPHVQTFLWWANVATRVHERYQSFFPPDVFYVADHAKRATSEFPLCRDHYYGVNYGERARTGVPPDERPRQFVPSGECQPNDLSWYANIPVPTSYMCMGTREDFFGGYDHAAQAGVLHVANHHISPGKKQWTWGNHEFGYAWDRNLTHADGPYIELMAGVYTDNQPDFSFLTPGETKTWSQFWYPIQKIGPAHHASLDAAAHLVIDARKIRVGVCVSAEFPGATIRLEHKARKLEWKADLKPGAPFLKEHKQTAPKWPREGPILRVIDRDGREILAYELRRPKKGTVPPAATQPLPPAEITSADELYLTGLHLEQYRHATRLPETYWREALRRDPGDARCNLALGRWHLRRGEFTKAESHFRQSLERWRLRNPNPPDGEPSYQLGLALQFLDRPDEAYDAFYKATWNAAWQSAAFQSLAEIDCCRRQWSAALDHLDRCLRTNADNLIARNLQALVFLQTGRAAEAEAALRSVLQLDPLDGIARHLLGAPLTCNTQTRLDIALDFSRAGFFDHALRVLADATPEAGSGTAPLVSYYQAWIHRKKGSLRAALAACRRAAKCSPDYCFPSRLEEIGILESAIQINPKDGRAPCYLGNLLYDRRRHEEAIGQWEKAAALAPFSIVWRNLGLGFFNVRRQPRKAREAYEKAFKGNPEDGRLLYERDQLWKRLGEVPQKRRRELERHRHLVDRRDDLSVELCALYNQTGAPEKALEILSSRKFQPWEGGEGLVIDQYVRTHLALGRRELARDNTEAAIRHFRSALELPENLGEARHLLANQCDIFHWLGCALASAGQPGQARKYWKAAAETKGDFQEMQVRAYSEMTYSSARALQELGNKTASRKLFSALLAYARDLESTEAGIDYFATSLPSMLLFADDLQLRQTIRATFLQAQALAGLGRKKEAVRLLKKTLSLDPNHAGAADFLRDIS